MIDIKVLQNSFDEIAKKLQKRKIDESLLKSLKELSFELKEKKAILETLQAEQNAKSKLFPVYQKEGKDIASLKAELNENKQKISVAQEIMRETEEKLSKIAMSVPNIPDDSVPYGVDEEDNIELKKV